MHGGGYTSSLAGGVPTSQQPQQHQQQMGGLQGLAPAAIGNLAATPVRGRGGGPRVSNAIARALRQRQTAGTHPISVCSEPPQL